ncbi:3D domain-containing protein [Anaerosinus massiliensis]|uniref:3D domain-containing protein n=1 Tax=Massilibacillus massiliensis TaxID=1806837 RepID=UPI000B1F6CCD|nr:3D domain-containing protein [Massilibacillus massiliensis]
MQGFCRVLVALFMMMTFLINVSSFAIARESNENVYKETTVTNHQSNVKKLLVKQGMSGEIVKTVQNLLIGLGYGIGTADGVFGQKTFEAVRQFQMAHNLMPDGIVGEVTWSYLHRAEPITDRNMRSISMVASAYSAYDPGNSNTTSTGSLVRKGLVAVDPNVIPLGTRLYIPGYGNAIADDTGGAIRGNRIDLAFDSHQEAIQFGRREIVVYIIE